MGHDRFGSTPAPFEPSFQSTRPARDATRHILIGPHPCCSFNPRARGGRDATAPPRSVMHSHVSIHAPAGGATQKTISTRDENSSVSIHAPAGGATDKGQLVARHRVVSIHAPAGGATCPVATWRSSLHRFQSTRPRGARLSHHNSLIRRTVPAPLREPNACCQQRQTSKVSPGTNTLSINRLDMREPIRQSMSTWGSPQTGRPAECGMGQMVPRRSADHGSRRTALHRYARPYVASSGPGNRSEGCQPQGQSTPATDP